ncbi:MAG TPA: S-methyl-5-thioribose-1-phosphate isomerase, partial [Nitrospiraceae bacterium]|nr:S-methyl-5-thioribose-1-phosphate isomerase [Nitrospiraceae bacterium]
TVELKDGAVRLLDQSRLPEFVEFLDCRDYQAVADAIRSLEVRGAPAIGVTAAMGVALGAQTVTASDYESVANSVLLIGDHLAAPRPTAVNLFWAIERMKQLLASLRTKPVVTIKAALLKESQVILDEDIALCKAMGQHGAELITNGQTVLTHCNAGALATAGYGTALGVIRAAWEQGKQIQVIADETRPVLQGARLTAWELMQDKIPVTLITDNMAGTLMRQGKIQLCVVGADRIAANGDVANKIGTYSVAVLAKAHEIPSYCDAGGIDHRHHHRARCLQAGRTGRKISGECHPCNMSQLFCRFIREAMDTLVVAQGCSAGSCYQNRRTPDRGSTKTLQNAFHDSRI